MPFQGRSRARSNTPSIQRWSIDQKLSPQSITMSWYTKVPIRPILPTAWPSSLRGVKTRESLALVRLWMIKSKSPSIYWRNADPGFRTPSLSDGMDCTAYSQLRKDVRYRDPDGEDGFSRQSHWVKNGSLASQQSDMYRDGICERSKVARAGLL